MLPLHTESPVRRPAGFACTVLAAVALFACALPTGAAPRTPARPAFAIAIHGGAGTLSRSEMTPEREAAYRASLAAALDAGYAVLERGGSSLDAVETAVRTLEDDPLFNAGKGAVFTWDGRNELDASIMDGATRRAGAVTGVQHIRNPVSLARLVMEKSKHVLLAREGAEEFAIDQGVPLVPRSYFYTQRRWDELQRARAAGTLAAASLKPFGTVGAVARDRDGRLAAATSTGGMTAKRWGRIGDSPIVGAGTYANARVAVSATGDGEYFMRVAVARDIAARVEYRGDGIASAARATIADVGTLGGEGGVIVMDADGAVAFEFNSEGMYRGMRDATGRRSVGIYHDPP